MLPEEAPRATIVDALAVRSQMTIGTLGRLARRDDFRWEIAADCTSSSAHQDSTTFRYDLPYAGRDDQEPHSPERYGYTPGQLTAAMTAMTSIGIGYDSHGAPVVRDEWFGSGPSSAPPHSVVDARGRDGRLLARTMTSSFLTGYNAAGVFGYSIGYDSAGDPVQINAATYDPSGNPLPISGSPAARAAAYWLAGTNGADPVTGPFDALGRLSSERWDAGAVSKSRTFLPNSNLASGYSTTLSGGTNVYTVSSMSWQGSLLKGYLLSSTWDGGGTAFSAAYDSDLHLQQWSAGPVGAAGAAQQKFAEAYGFSLENLKTVNVTNSLGFAVTSTYGYDPNSPERVTSISSPNAATSDTFVYDRRNRGLVVQHKLGASQAVPQDSYEYDSQSRLISIAHLGAKLETLDYDGAGDLASRTFPSGSPDLARSYVGDDLTLVDRGGAGNVGYAHIRLGNTRIASLYAKSGATSTLTYYHRDRRNDVVATTTSGGTLGVSYRYLPSGALDKTIGTETDTSASELGFIGGLKLSRGLIHLKARVYSPGLRRFLQPDTIDPRRYTYSHGDGLNFVDPSGRKDKAPTGAVELNPNQQQGCLVNCDTGAKPPTLGPQNSIDWGSVWKSISDFFKDAAKGDPTGSLVAGGSINDSLGQLSNSFVSGARNARSDISAVGSWVSDHRVAATIAAVGMIIALSRAEEVGASLPSAEAAEEESEAIANTALDSVIKVIGKPEDTKIAKELGTGYEVLSEAGWSLRSNIAWVMDGIRNGATFYTASPINFGTLTGDPRYNGGASIYAVELYLLNSANYIQQGAFLVPGR